MKIIVCAKIINGEINPFDACALETALRLSSDVTVISMAPLSARPELERLTRLGAKVISLTDNVFAGSDTLATSYILSCAINKLDYDLILCGRQTTDGDTAQVGPCLATMLGIHPITNVLEISSQADNEIVCRTRMGEESSAFPSLLTIERICDLRFPSIFSKPGTVEVWDSLKIGADISRCGQSGSPTRVLKSFESDKGTRKCKFITMDELDGLINTLVNQKKQDISVVESQVKLKNVWAVGTEIANEACAIAEDVTFIDETDPRKIAEMAHLKKPEVILWNANLWGRKNAPIVAALLQTGLCADCTSLATDGKRLYMYRPAFGGNIIAKIECKTTPVMATLRTTSDFSDIIVSAGKGASDSFAKVKAFADKYNADLCASRGLVDTGKVPYPMQVGLTGKTVAPKIYVAIGISGAVQHTCGIENADVVIAVNPDKDARIFEYADYGIIAEF